MAEKAISVALHLYAIQLKEGINSCYLATLPDCLNFPLLNYPCDISEGKHEGEGGGRHRGEHDALARAHHGLGAAGDRQEPAAQERNTGMRGSGQ